MFNINVRKTMWMLFGILVISISFLDSDCKSRNATIDLLKLLYL